MISSQVSKCIFISYICTHIAVVTACLCTAGENLRSLNPELESCLHLQSFPIVSPVVAVVMTTVLSSG